MKGCRVTIDMYKIAKGGRYSFTLKLKACLDVLPTYVYTTLLTTLLFLVVEVASVSGFSCCYDNTDFQFSCILVASR